MKNIAAGLRRNARDSRRPLALLGLHVITNRTSRHYAEALALGLVHASRRRAAGASVRFSASSGSV
ncbi:hypothetical protein QF026_000184 [Streptomyces aurantiacus]|uniref:hypothetical protein n=1 Tax=Streptomyces aurantiacus TaxID=47760 RepID=UPI0027914CE3|nr:hypothetical protein [Streptomyces aurantiacus]MDQ0771718.1 hypothetical protein [Streptomyces aurantiacus]